ncbi:hypothetical protein SEEE1392_16690 [Salmonella enterica subsp. enterica serovar Enteritidis str. 648901 39-2]|nr:hypothetical protein SEEE1580_16630 [Salmonella enterica subsp. enterica serovar Enteritidis str. CDC_2010K_1580]ELO31413.1 hypothetical protein SEEE1392_16690 [Salmonella enterica subsp. enterica serovar Enteritidis str. 648901 39-2]ESG84235.1 hypothetical protein SEEK5349_05830 [Salmonella enterica subsp. enterica serovar Kentucky str. 5349]
MCLRCYGNKACWKGREPDQHKKTAQLSGFFVDLLKPNLCRFVLNQPER